MEDNIDDQYDEAMELFGGTIPKIGEPVEYIVTDKAMTEEYQKALIKKYGHLPLPTLNEEYAKALIEKYGHIPDLNEMVAVDEQPDD